MCNGLCSVLTLQIGHGKSVAVYPGRVEIRGQGAQCPRTHIVQPLQQSKSHI